MSQVYRVEGRRVDEGEVLIANNKRCKLTSNEPEPDVYSQVLRLSDEMLREILSWDMREVPEYTAAELAERASMPEAQSIAPGKRIPDSQH